MHNSRLGETIPLPLPYSSAQSEFPLGSHPTLILTVSLEWQVGRTWTCLEKNQALETGLKVVAFLILNSKM